jgi:single-stranded-DNA-specific exonuclease
LAEWLLKNKLTEVTDIEIRGKKIPKVIVQILQNRGCDSAEAIEKYFAPSLSDLYDPFLINDMEKAIERIVRAIHKKEKVLVHGDYDTDGITGTALVVNNLKKFGLEVEYYIPHRLTEGYGLSPGGINHAIKRGCSLVITVDCGITATDEVLHANKNNVDVIICDHHKPKEILPEGFALLNPKIPGSKYPFKELAGVGVAFKMLQALYMKLKMPEEDIFEDLDLVALGSVVDVVPLIGENRILVKYGIKRITESQKIGFQAMLKQTDLRSGLTSYHLGFIIGPRINACGRLRHAKEALELFLTDDQSTAEKLVRNLSCDNKTRQEIEKKMYQEAQDLIKKQGIDRNRIIIAGKEDWHEGVVGIVASRISGDYYRPAIIFSLKKDVAKGSARSIPDFDITEALSFCSNLLTEYGGHSQAAGLSMKIDKFAELQECINEYAQKFEDSIFERRNLYDIKLNLDEITDDVVYFLKYFEPTGMANPQPVFLGECFQVVGVPRVVGSDHLKFAVRNKDKVFNAIAFGQAEKILDIEMGKPRIDCLYSISEDSFFGKRKVVLKIKEMRKTSGTSDSE